MHAIDLTAALASLKRAPELRRIAGLIEATRDYESLRRDLERAEQSIDKLGQLDQPAADATHAQELDTAIICQALLMNSLMLYTRSTSTSSRHRRKLHVSEFYSGDQLDLHRNLIDLRNNTMAHFGTGKDAGYTWNDQRVVVVRRNDLLIGKFPSITTNYQGWAAQALYDLTPLCARLATENCLKSLDLLITAIKSSAEASSICEQHYFDPEAFFKDPRGVAEFWKDGLVNDVSIRSPRIAAPAKPV